MKARWVAALLLATAIAAALLASRVVSPSFEEIPRVGAARQLEAVIREVAQGGLGALVAPEHRATFLRLTPSLMPLLGGWANLSFARVGLLDPLTATRLPLLLVIASGPLGLFLLLRPHLGLRRAALSALLLLALPRFLQGTATTSNAACLCSLALLFAACAQQARLGRRRVAWSLAASATVALGMAHLASTLWLVLALLAAHSLREFSWRGSSGYASAPGWLLPTVAAIPIGWIALDPALWTQGTVGIAKALLGHLRLDSDAVWVLGKTYPRPPAGFSALFWLSTLPLPLWVGALIAAPLAARQQFASWREVLRALRAGPAVELLCLFLLGLFSSALPALLARPSDFVLLGLPAVCAAFVVGVDHFARRLGRRFAVVMPLLAALTVVPGLVELPTAAAHHGVILGGTKHVLAARLLPVGDGSELGALAPRFAALGVSPLPMEFPSRVPADYFRYLRWSGRTDVEVVPAAVRQGRVQLGFAGQPGDVGSVVRDGAVVWSLTSR
ncbi:MAG: hypothetical protein R3B13_23380 [Polyangiaceae bacterium]